MTIKCYFDVTWTGPEAKCDGGDNVTPLEKSEKPQDGRIDFDDVVPKTAEYIRARLTGWKDFGHLGVEIDIFVRPPPPSSLKDDVTCGLREKDYQVISHTWGDPPNSPFVELNKRKCSVASSLRNAYRYSRIRTPSQPGISLWKLLEHLGRYQSHEPHDKIYGVLGLASDSSRIDMHPDYSKPVKELLGDLVQSHYQQLREKCDILACSCVKVEKPRHPQLLDFGIPRLNDLGSNCANNRISPSAKDSFSWIWKNSDFKDWIDGSAGSVLWLGGEPGVGKATLMKSLLQDCPRFTHDTSSGITVHYFFDQNVLADGAGLARAFRSILVQLAGRNGIPVDLHDAMGIMDEPWIVSPLVWKQVLFRSFARRSSPICVFIDGLDECNAQDRSVFLDIVRGLTSELKSHLRVCLTSRSVHERVSGDDLVLDVGRTSKDVHSFDTAPSYDIWNLDSVFTQFMPLLQGHPCGDDTMRVHEDHLAFSQRHRLVKWISLAARPLSVLELYEALQLHGPTSWNPHDVSYSGKPATKDDSMSWPSVVRLIQDLQKIHGIVQIEYSGARSDVSVWPLAHDAKVHFVLPKDSDYFDKLVSCGTYATDSAYCTGRGLPFNSSAAIGVSHLEIAVACLEYLRASTNSSTTELTMGGSGTKFATKFPFFDYALTSWLSHLAAANAEDVPDEEFRKNLRAVTWSFSAWSGNLKYRAQATHHHFQPLFMECVRQGLDKPIKAWLSDQSITSNHFNQYVDHNEKTPLHVAASHGYLKVVALLLDGGANVNALDPLVGNSALHWAAHAAKHGDSAQVAQLLLDEGANVNEVSNGMTALHLAATYGHTAMVEILIRRGADPNEREKGTHRTALFLAASNGHVDTVEHLLKVGANPNVTDAATGLGPLHFAALLRSPEMAALLISNGAFFKVDSISILSKTATQWITRLALLLTPNKVFNTKAHGMSGQQEKSTEKAPSPAVDDSTKSKFASNSARGRNSLKRTNNDKDDKRDDSRPRKVKINPKPDAVRVLCPYLVHADYVGARKCQRWFSDGHRLKQHLWEHHMLAECPGCGKDLCSEDLQCRKRLHTGHADEYNRHKTAWNYMNGFAFDQVDKLERHVTGSTIVEKFVKMYQILFPGKNVPDQNLWVLPAGTSTIFTAMRRENDSTEPHREDATCPRHGADSTFERPDAFGLMSNPVLAEHDRTARHALSPGTNEEQHQPSTDQMNNDRSNDSPLSPVGASLAMLIRAHLEQNPQDRSALRRETEFAHAGQNNAFMTSSMARQPDPITHHMSQNGTWSRMSSGETFQNPFPYANATGISLWSPTSSQPGLMQMGLFTDFAHHNEDTVSSSFVDSRSRTDNSVYMTDISSAPNDETYQEHGCLKMFQEDLDMMNVSHVGASEDPWQGAEVANAAAGQAIDGTLGAQLAHWHE